MQASRGRVTDTPIVVDCFSRSIANSKDSRLAGCPNLFFLTHAHADHMTGLSSSWDLGKIYCTAATKVMINEKFPGFDMNLVVTLPVNESSLIPLNRSNSHTLRVTPIDARNHCPGACLYLFEGYFGTILYTGDFRFDHDSPLRSLLPSLPSDTKNDNASRAGACSACAASATSNRRYSGSPILGSQSQTDSAHQNILQGKVIDRLYLDNSFCHPRYDFLSTEQCALRILELVRQHEGHQIIIGGDTLGKEEMLVLLSRLTRSLIAVPPPRFRAIQALAESGYSLASPADTMTSARILASAGVDPLSQGGTDAAASADEDWSRAFTDAKEDAFIRVVPKQQLSERVLRRLNRQLAADRAKAAEARIAEQRELHRQELLKQLWLRHHQQQQQSDAVITDQAAHQGGLSQSAHQPSMPMDASDGDLAPAASSVAAAQAVNGAVVPDGGAAAAAATTAPTSANADMMNDGESKQPADIDDVQEIRAKCLGVIGVLPTGWTCDRMGTTTLASHVHTDDNRENTPPSSISSSDSQQSTSAQPSAADTKQVLFMLPYSSHCSFAELCDFVRCVKPRSIVPIVDGNLEHVSSTLSTFLHGSPPEPVLIPPELRYAFDPPSSAAPQSNAPVAVGRQPSKTAAASRPVPQSFQRRVRGVRFEPAPDDERPANEAASSPTKRDVSLKSEAGASSASPARAAASATAVESPTKRVKLASGAAIPAVAADKPASASSDSDVIDITEERRAKSAIASPRKTAQLKPKPDQLHDLMYDDDDSPLAELLDAVEEQQPRASSAAPKRRVLPAFMRLHDHEVKMTAAVASTSAPSRHADRDVVMSGRHLPGASNTSMRDDHSTLPALLQRQAERRPQVQQRQPIGGASSSRPAETARPKMSARKAYLLALLDSLEDEAQSAADGDLPAQPSVKSQVHTTSDRAALVERKDVSDRPAPAKQVAEKPAPSAIKPLPSAASNTVVATSNIDNRSKYTGSAHKRRLLEMLDALPP